LHSKRRLHLIPRRKTFNKSECRIDPDLANAAAGRFFGFATADGRKPPQNPEEQAAAFRSMIAYTGKFRLEGDKFITRVDVAWNEGWVGTEQVRFWRVEGGKLYITSAPIPNPNVPGAKMIGILIWERE
jgi:hypothetical protein